MDEGINRPLDVSKTFEECFPFYLSIGMSSDEYWNGDSSLPKHYRKAYQLKQENVNREAWLHGLYVYDAVTSAMTRLNKDKHSHKNYAAKPYSFTPEEIEEENENKVAEAEAQAEVWMKSWVSATQKMFKKE